MVKYTLLVWSKSNKDNLFPINCLTWQGYSKSTARPNAKATCTEDQ